jgi:hypothetical protein
MACADAASNPMAEKCSDMSVKACLTKPDLDEVYTESAALSSPRLPDRAGPCLLPAARSQMSSARMSMQKLAAISCAWRPRAPPSDHLGSGAPAWRAVAEGSSPNRRL